MKLNFNIRHKGVEINARRKSLYLGLYLSI